MITQFPRRDTSPRVAARAARLHLGRLAVVLGAVTCAVLSFADSVPAAFASRMPAPGPVMARFGPVGATTVTHASTADGTPGWQIGLIAFCVILVATAAVALHRTLDRRRQVPAIAA
jgi:hypothetical protein